jgi:hypothetical protein
MVCDKTQSLKKSKVFTSHGKVQSHTLRLQTFFHFFEILWIIHKTEIVGRFIHLFKSCSKCHENPMQDDWNVFSHKLSQI